jgi:glutamate/tyrosine decarboxylase-like PLP-dependent enzyme
MSIIISEDKLRQQPAAVEMDRHSFREAGYQLVNDIAGLISSMREFPVTTSPTPGKLQGKLPVDFPSAGTDPAVLLRETWELLVHNSLFNGHPRFWGYITSSPAPMGILGDLMASAINSNCGAYVLSPVATEIEKQTIHWLGEWIGYPADGGIMVSGGNMANFVGFLAARKAKANWDIRKLGLAPAQGKWRMYTSAETHTWISKAADLFGLGLDAIQWIPVDAEQRMDILILEQKIIEDKNQGLIPLLVIATAGSVGTGAIDPLNGIASICKKQDCWFHIDGAYGGFAAALPELKKDFQGIDQADSIAIDPHKWLYSPLEAGCTLVKDRAALSDAFSFHPTYYNFEGREEPQTNYYEQGLQNSRGFRALKVWLTLRHLGAAGHAQLIREDIRLAKRLHVLLQNEEEIETFTQHLSITTFRYRPAGLDINKDPEYLNTLNQAILNDLQSGGKVFPSNAVLNGNFLLRVCIVNFRTTSDDIDLLPDIVIQTGKRIDTQLRNTETHPGKQS